MELPPGSTVLDTHAFGTYDGTRYDGIDPSALYDCFFQVPGSFANSAAWFDTRLRGLGWPEGEALESAPVGELRLAWRRWSREKDTFDLLDFTEADWTMFQRPPPGSSLLRITFSRRPAREFASEAEYQMWFTDNDRGKGERWRQASIPPLV